MVWKYEQMYSSSIDTAIKYTRVWTGATYLYMYCAF